MRTLTLPVDGNAAPLHLAHDGERVHIEHAATVTSARPGDVARCVCRHGDRFLLVVGAIHAGLTIQQVATVRGWA